MCMVRPILCVSYIRCVSAMLLLSYVILHTSTVPLVPPVPPVPPSHLPVFVIQGEPQHQAPRRALLDRRRDCGEVLHDGGFGDPVPRRDAAFLAPPRGAPGRVGRRERHVHGQAYGYGLRLRLRLLFTIIMHIPAFLPPTPRLRTLRSRRDPIFVHYVWICQSHTVRSLALLRSFRPTAGTRTCLLLQTGFTLHTFDRRPRAPFCSGASWTGTDLRGKGTGGGP